MTTYRHRTPLDAVRADVYNLVHARPENIDRVAAEFRELATAAEVSADSAYYANVARALDILHKAAEYVTERNS